MSFSTLDRVHVRHFLGFASIFTQADPRLENALTAIQSITEGGSQPDNSSENFVKSTVADLLELECELKKLWKAAMALEAGKNKIDAYRGMAMLRAEGRRLVHGLSSILSTSKRQDVFAGAPSNPDGDAFYSAPGGAGFQW